MKPTNSPERRQIEGELRRIELLEKADPVAFFGNRHKDTREWMVLGHVRRLLDSVQLDAPAFATKLEPPDFATFDLFGQPWAFVEIAEAMVPGRRRHQEYKAEEEWLNKLRAGSHGGQQAPPSRGIPDTPPVLTPLRQQILKKAAKRYPSPICLILYYNLDWCARRGRMIPLYERLLEDVAREPYEGVESFDRVLVLSAEFGGLVELHPETKVIVKDNPWS